MENTNLRFTYRQQEFARLYASGLSAPKAAIHAGYSSSTCETNAARLLKHPAVKRLIETLRSQRHRVEAADNQAAIARLRHIIQYSQDDTKALQAIQELRLAEAAQFRISVMSSIPPAQAEAIMPTVCEVDDKTDSNVEGKTKQKSGQQALRKSTTNSPVEPVNLAVEEQDLLPDGRPASDVRLRATPALPPMQDNTIPVQFFPTQGGYDPTPDSYLSNT